ncbi:unnamed protein product [Ascophyllum nodosum]
MLRSTMFASYNRFNDAKVQIGPWREELALKELTGVTRVANPKNQTLHRSTGERVIFHTDTGEAKDRGKTTFEASFVDPMAVPGTKNRLLQLKPGPRAVKAKQELLTIIRAEDAAIAFRVEAAKNQRDLDTTFRQSFKWYSDEAAKQAMPKRFTSRGKSTRQRQRIRISSTREDTSDIASSRKKELGLYSTGTTVTLWNAPDLAPNAAAASGAFGRTSRFSEPGVHPSFYQQAFPDPAPRHPSLPSGLSESEASSLAILKRRVIERARENVLPSIRGLWRLLWPRTDLDAAGKIGRREFREGLAEFKVPMTSFELWVVSTVFDIDGSGQIFLDKVVQFLRYGALSAYRRGKIREAFRRLDPQNSGSVTLGHLHEACAFWRYPAVKDGLASEEDVKALFLDHLEPHHSRPDSQNIRIPFEVFQEAFHDIGSACLDPCTIQPTCAGGIDLLEDDRETDPLFESVVACVG